MGSVYKHALCLHPYYRDSHSGSLGIAVFPPIGLEYIAAALQPHVERVTLVDLRLPGPMRTLRRLKKFVNDEVDLLCISINWEYQFDEVCELVNALPHDVFHGCRRKTGHRRTGESLRNLPRSRYCGPRRRRGDDC